MPHDRGDWVISTWGCDLAIHDVSLDLTTATFDETKKSLNARLGQDIRSIRINPANVSLIIGLEDDSEVLLQTDRDNTELNQWFITTASGRSIGAGWIP